MDNWNGRYKMIPPWDGRSLLEKWKALASLGGQVTL